MSAIRTLVLSGGGGRGAFHAGVYRYLSQIHKPGVDGDHQGEWKPDIVVGTSIGAVNGAAIVQGIEADDLVEFWRSLREHDIEGLPPTMTPFARMIVGQVMKKVIGVKLPDVTGAEATSPKDLAETWPLLKLGKLGAALLGRWANLLDTAPLRSTITNRLGLDEAKINASPGRLLINATHVQTGQRVTFSNHPIHKRGSGEVRNDVLAGITIQRILASCSIPLVYPWTRDEISNSFYWDGALVANTPLGVSLDAASDWPVDDVMEVVVVLMTPWNNDGIVVQKRKQLPDDFAEAVTWALDWALLASFRERMDLIDAYNRLREHGKRIDDPLLSAIREVKVVVVAPEDFYDAERIIDYDEKNNELIQEGYAAAEKAFTGNFSGAGYARSPLAVGHSKA